MVAEQTWKRSGLLNWSTDQSQQQSIASTAIAGEAWSTDQQRASRDFLTMAQAGEQQGQEPQEALASSHKYRIKPPTFDGNYAHFEEWKYKFTAYMGLTNNRYHYC